MSKISSMLHCLLIGTTLLGAVYYSCIESVEVNNDHKEDIFKYIPFASAQQG